MELENIPTDKLQELELKYHSHVKDELIEPSFNASQEIEEERQDGELLEELTTFQIEKKTKLNVD